MFFMYFIPLGKFIEIPAISRDDGLNKALKSQGRSIEIPAISRDDFSNSPI